MAIKKGKNLVNGEWRDGSGPEFDSTNPYTGEVTWTGRSASNSDVLSAVSAALNVADAWRQLEVSERAAYLTAFAEIVKLRREELIAAITDDAGKPLWEAATEVDAVAAKVAPTIEAHKLRNATREQVVGEAVSVTRFRPHGVVAVLGPFNFPAHMANGHMMPALLAGNTVVLKPSEQTPLVAQLISECWEEAGLPSGVVNLIHGGRETASVLAADERIRGVFLTGSVQAGRALTEIASGRRIPPLLALEMGGNSPLVVWDYESVKAAILIAVQSTFVTAGQRCSAARRLIVQRDDGDFVEGLVSVLQRIKIGDPRADDPPYYGPLISPTAAQRVLDEQARLVSLGAVPLLRAELRDSPGRSLVSPGLIDVSGIIGVGDDEVFGPLLKLERVESFDAAVAVANDTSFGLAAGIVTRERSRYERFLDQIDAGIVNWNQPLTGAASVAPFGGTKQSGNFHPAGFLSADYSVYATASLEVAEPAAASVPPGFTF